MNNVENQEILPGYRSEHSVIILSLKLNNFIKGKGSVYYMTMTASKNESLHQKYNQAIKINRKIFFKKNWRPISLLNASYLIASRVIADRIKPF